MEKSYLGREKEDWGGLVKGRSGKDRGPPTLLQRKRMELGVSKRMTMGQPGKKPGQGGRN